jgi:PHD/YefM family antitoxin component YafN of YafNO toxin-antitoxin module
MYYFQKEVRTMQDTITTNVIDKVEEMEPVSKINLRVSLNKITEQPKRDGQLVITDNDSAVAIMLKADDFTLEDTLLDLRRLQMQRAIKTIQDVSVKNGTSKMTLNEINAEITVARAAIRTR